MHQDGFIFLQLVPHRYTYPAGVDSAILFDTGATPGQGPMSSSLIRKVNSQEISGYSIMAPTRRRPKATPICFVARFNKPMKAFGVWGRKHRLGPKTLQTKNMISGKDIGGYARFETKNQEVILMKVAISYTSIEGARRNLDGELPHWDFDRIRNESRSEWDRELGKIKIQGGSPAQKTKFYTDLWHALLGRRTVSDLDGRYQDQTGKDSITRQITHKQGHPAFDMMNFDALWGSQWSINILWSLVYPEVVDNFINTMLTMYDNGGLIPRGPSGGNYTFVMIGDPAAPFITSAWHKGIRGYNIEKAYAGLRKNALPGGIRDRAGYEHGTSPPAAA